MRRKKAIKRGRWASVLVAAMVGYVLGSWNAAAVHSSQASSAADRRASGSAPLPERLATGRIAARAPPPRRRPISSRPNPRSIVHNANSALFAPEPMLPTQSATAQAAEPAEAQQAADGKRQCKLQTFRRRASMAPAHVAAAPILPKPREVASTTKPVPVRRQARPGHMFDDAQLASIKRRLNLTPDQEQMWPAVAVALRNIGISAGARSTGARRECRETSIPTARKFRI